MSSAVTVRVDVDAQELSIEHPDTMQTTTFRTEDFVVLSSQLSDEDFYGQLVALDGDEVRLVLVCGTPARTTVDALRTGRCALKHQPQPQDPLRFDEREIVNTKRIRRESQLRTNACLDLCSVGGGGDEGADACYCGHAGKRGRRRRTMDIRRGF